MTERRPRGVKKERRYFGSRQQKAYDRAADRGEFPAPEAVMWNFVVDWSAALQKVKDETLAAMFKSRARAQ